MKASRGRHFGGGKPPVVHRRGDERAVAASVGKPREIVGPTNPATG